MVTLQSKTLDAQTIDPMKIIPCRNGLLDISQIGGELNLYEHTPRFFSLWSLPFIFDPEAKCPQWETFLQDVLEDDDRIELLQRWFGLCLTHVSAHDNHS